MFIQSIQLTSTSYILYLLTYLCDGVNCRSTTIFRSPPEEECDGVAKGVISPKGVGRKTKFQSVLDRVRAGGANSELYHGPNDEILL